MKVFLVDNYDSFTYNLVELLRVCGVSDIIVQKNDQVRYEDIEECDKIIFSPGPALPKDAPIMAEIVVKYGEKKSILGVCLGHQAIGELFGGTLYNLKKVVHGQRKAIDILDSQAGIFKDLPAEIFVGLYHSWAVCAEGLPDTLEVTAVDKTGIVMAFRHRKLDITGVQFHPESYMTDLGKKMLKNWLACG